MQSPHALRSFHVNYEPIEGQGNNMDQSVSIEIWEFLVMHNTLTIDSFIRVIEMD
jgi:hypothetical protein